MTSPLSFALSPLSTTKKNKKNVWHVWWVLGVLFRQKMRRRKKKHKINFTRLSSFLQKNSSNNSRRFARLPPQSTTNPANTRTSRKRPQLAWMARALRSRKVSTSSAFARALTAATCNAFAKPRLRTVASP